MSTSYWLVVGLTHVFLAYKGFFFRFKMGGCVWNVMEKCGGGGGLIQVAIGVAKLERKGEGRNWQTREQCLELTSSYRTLCYSLWYFVCNICFGFVHLKQSAAFGFTVWFGYHSQW